MSCGRPKDCRDCCNSRVEGAPTDCVSPTAAPALPRNITCPRCKGRCSVCGGDVASFMRMFDHGVDVGRRLQREQQARDNEPARWHE